MTAALRLKPGTVFAGDYRVVQRLAGGGMGSIYLVEQLSTGARRALKLMLPHLVDDEDARKRFEREAKVGALIPSDHVVQVIAAGVDEATGAPWLAMELVEGESLDSRVKNLGPLSWPDAAELFSQLGHALGAAHEASIVHRDLKPENLFVGVARRPGTPFSMKVLDFGIAKIVAEAGNASATAPIGTLAWMAPEQTELGAAVTPATDVWSIGLVAFWSLSGKSYWLSANDASGSAPSFVRELVAAPLVKASQRVLEVSGAPLPPGFDAWFERCVVRSMTERFPDGGVASAELAALLRSAAATSKPEATGDELVPASSNPQSVEPKATVPPGASKRGKVLAVASGATLLGGAAALALSFTQVLPKLNTASSSVAEWQSATPPLASAPVKPTAITALPPPACQNAKALGLYAASLQAMRDANWDHATERLREAVALEPSCAALQLRMAMAADEPKEARASFARALEGRAQLDERDRVFLEAYEPGLREPHDNNLVAERARSATKRFPMDAEFFELLSAYSPDDEEAVQAARRATELDPGYADAWHDLATHLEHLGKNEEALGALERCVTVSPTTADCRSRRATFYSLAGKCEEAEKDLRQAIASSPRSAELRNEWVNVLKELRRPRETIVEALAQKWPLIPEPERSMRKAFDLLWLDSEYGPMTNLQARIAEIEQIISTSPDALPHAMLAQSKVQMLLSEGKNREAAKVADDYLKRVDGWSGASDQSWVEIPMRIALFKGGLSSREELDAARKRWIESTMHANPPRQPWDAWGAAFKPQFQDSEENEAALAGKPEGEPKNPWQAAFLGAAYAFTGQAALAIPLLKRGLASCNTRGSYFQGPLGIALEATGDNAGACAAYSTFVKDSLGWSPHPNLAKHVKARIVALRCETKNP